MCQGLFQIPRGWERNNQEVEHDFIIIKRVWQVRFHTRQRLYLWHLPS